VMSLAREIVELMSEYKKRTKFYLFIIGHSIGGLFARSCLRYLFENPAIWECIIPVGFVTLATPHLGIRRPKSITNVTCVVLEKILYRSRSMEELLLEDFPIRSNDDKPLLVIMAEPKGPYMLPLEQFAFRTLISNVKRDCQCPYATSAISYWNPYKANKMLKRGSYRVIGESGFHEDLKYQITPQSQALEEYNPCFPQLDTRKKRKKKKPKDLILMGKLFVPDNEKKIKFLPGMVQNLNQLQWRRLDVELSSILFNHEYIIHKASLPLEHPWHGKVVIESLIKILVSDFNKLLEEENTKR